MAQDTVAESHSGVVADMGACSRCPFNQRAEVHPVTCADLHGAFSRRFNVPKYHHGITPVSSSCCLPPLWPCA
jgi:hypothetical protein